LRHVTYYNRVERLKPRATVRLFGQENMRLQFRCRGHLCYVLLGGVVVLALRNRNIDGQPDDHTVPSSWDVSAVVRICSIQVVRAQPLGDVLSSLQLVQLAAACRDGQCIHRARLKIRLVSSNDSAVRVLHGSVKHDSSPVKTSQARDHRPQIGCDRANRRKTDVRVDERYKHEK
jgi:hypothetical protein